MPRNNKANVEYLLALSPAQTALSLGIRPERVQDAIRDKKLTVRKLGMKHRIAVPQIMAWLESWDEVVPRKTKRPQS